MCSGWKAFCFIYTWRECEPLRFTYAKTWAHFPFLKCKQAHETGAAVGRCRWLFLIKLLWHIHCCIYQSAALDWAHLGPWLLYTCLCCTCAGVNPRVKSGRFMKLLPDYEHMDYKDVYTHCMYMSMRGCVWDSWKLNLQADYFNRITHSILIIHVLIILLNTVSLHIKYVIGGQMVWCAVFFFFRALPERMQITLFPLGLHLIIMKDINHKLLFLTMHLFISSMVCFCVLVLQCFTHTGISWGYGSLT